MKMFDILKKFFVNIKLPIYLIGFVGSSTLAYIFYSPSSKYKKKIKKGHPRGLINCKNECFINVILQSLSASNKVTEWLLANKSNSNLSTNLFDTLGHIILRINRLEFQIVSSKKQNKNILNNKFTIQDENDFDEDQEEFYAAKKFKKALIAHNWVIKSEEHDCHELFHLIMDILDEESLESKKYFSSLNYFRPSHLKENSSLNWKNPFHGYFISQLECLDCYYKYPMRIESFYSLSLSLPNQKMNASHFSQNNLFDSLKAGVTLIECINNYFKCEYIKEMKCENCFSKDKEIENFESNKTRNRSVKNLKGLIKKQAIAKLPECLCIQIQRNYYDMFEHEMVKQINYVKFPLTIKIDNHKESKISQLNNKFVDISKNPSFNNNLIKNDNECPLSAFFLKQVGIGCILGGNKQIKCLSKEISNKTTKLVHQSYKLKSAIVHYGSALSGHFIVYRKSLASKDSDDWLQISDTEIKNCDLNNLLASNVYMLFYDKI